jgi:hypothetical protein
MSVPPGPRTRVWRGMVRLPPHHPTTSRRVLAAHRGREPSTLSPLTAWSTACWPQRKKPVSSTAGTLPFPNGGRAGGRAQPAVQRGGSGRSRRAAWREGGVMRRSPRPTVDGSEVQSGRAEAAPCDGRNVARWLHPVAGSCIVDLRSHRPRRPRHRPRGVRGWAGKAGGRLAACLGRQHSRGLGGCPDSQ